MTRCPMRRSRTAVGPIRGQDILAGMPSHFRSLAPIVRVLAVDENPIGYSSGFQTPPASRSLTGQLATFMTSFEEAVMQGPSDSHMTRPQNCPVKVP
ncbi:hypothetical protein SAMN04487916_11161 [Arthrobacter sp. ov407]|nr:hypothetical protein SAMN04487916_11161 [Arthrobacter sp. ov407]